MREPGLGLPASDGVSTYLKLELLSPDRYGRDLDEEKAFPPI